MNPYTAAFHAGAPYGQKDKQSSNRDGSRHRGEHDFPQRVEVLEPRLIHRRLPAAGAPLLKSKRAKRVDRRSGAADNPNRRSGEEKCPSASGLSGLRDIFQIQLIE